MWASPAKINLFLRIMRRRSDNYHELASLFQTISLCDYLSINESDTDLLICNNPAIPTGSSNLIWKAINLFRIKTGKKVALKIILDKHIPIEAGLGGGSSNAATALWALNCLMGNLVTSEELQLWAGQIGSDVPFFLSQGSAYCTGRGEIVRPLLNLPKKKLWIIKPVKGLPTPAVFKQLNLRELEPRDPEETLMGFVEGNACYFNDLEAPAYELMPELLNFKKSLLAMGFQHVLLSGSGTAFACFGEEASVSVPECQAYFQRPVHFINRTPHNWYVGDL